MSLFSPDGTKLSVAFRGGKRLRIYSTATWGLVSEPLSDTTGTGDGRATEWANNGTIVMLGTTGAPYFMAFSGAAMVTSPVFSSPVYVIKTSKDGQKVAVGGGSGVHILDNGLSLLRQFDVGGAVYGLSWSYDGRYLAVATNISHGLKIFDSSSWEEIWACPNNLGVLAGYSVAFMPETP